MIGLPVYPSIKWDMHRGNIWRVEQDTSIYRDPIVVLTALYRPAVGRLYSQVVGALMESARGKAKSILDWPIRVRLRLAQEDDDDEFQLPLFAELP